MAGKIFAPMHSLPHTIHTYIETYIHTYIHRCILCGPGPPAAAPWRCSSSPSSSLEKQWQCWHRGGCRTGLSTGQAGAPRPCSIPHAPTLMYVGRPPMRGSTSECMWLSMWRCQLHTSRRSTTPESSRFEPARCCSQVTPRVMTHTLID